MATPKSSVPTVSIWEATCRLDAWSATASAARTTNGNTTLRGGAQPPGAETTSRLRRVCFRFPTEEKHGIVWAFNGERSPVFAIPNHGFAQNELVTRVGTFPQTMPADPWVVAAHTPDVNRFTVGGKFEFLTPPAEQVLITSSSFSYRLHARVQNGSIYDVWEIIYGTNIFLQLGKVNGRELFWLTAYGLPRPGTTSAVFRVRHADR